MNENTNKVNKKNYIIKIISQPGGMTRSINLPVNTIKYGIVAIGLVIALFIGTFAYSIYNVSQLQKDKLEVNELRQANSMQQDQILQLSKKANALQEEMNKLNELELEIKQMAASNGIDVTRSNDNHVNVHDGQGGPRIEPDISIVNSVLDSLNQSVQVKQKSLENLKQVLANKKTEMSITPSIWPTNGDVSSRYGLRWNGSDFHPGIDIANDMGTPVVATADGVVISSGWNSGGYGYMVDIDHGNGIVTRYAHNSQLAVNSGDYVKKGQVISYMGSTGYSTGPHLHYEVIINGRAVNPSRFL